MTKIEQLRELAKQHENLYDNCITDGHIKSENDGNRIIIHTKGNGVVNVPTYAGKELLSALKQLYE